MGDLLSTPSSSPDTNNPNPTQNPIPMSPSSETPKSEEPKPQSETPESPDSKEPNNPVQETQKDPESRQDQEEGGGGDEEEEEEEGEGECEFCLYMKAGECKDAFLDWENCVREADEKKEDVVEKCHKVTEVLKLCMEAHPDHYGVILNAEKAAEKEVREELKAEEEATIYVAEEKEAEKEVREELKVKEQATIDVEKEQEAEGANKSVDSGNRKKHSEF